MKSIILGLFLLSILLAASPGAAVAAPAQQAGCPPSKFPVRASDCLQAGPWLDLRVKVEYGLADPNSILPAYSPDPSLSLLPFYYARVNTANAPIFASPSDAHAGKPVLRSMEPGLVYVTYQDVQEIDGKNYYMINFGEWMRRGDITPNQAYSQFKGLEFYATPTQTFAWVLENFQGGILQPTYTGPGLEFALAEATYNPFDMVFVYEIAEANGLRWFRVGADVWLESRQARLVIPNTTPPAGVDGGRWMDINLQEQTIAVYEDNQLVFATLIATGLPGVWTRPGLFQVYEKHESTLMRGVFTADRSDFYFLEDVPWAMYFDDARALHGAYWRARFGFEQSHGCVNLSVADSHWLFNWAALGDWVFVHDPSGRTPEDPSLYGSGGA
jgi:hypothetical protein